jgi:ribosomal protein RSM22 (predicted rRNA methylase)
MNFLDKIEEQLKQFPQKEIKSAYEEMSSYYKTKRDQIQLSLKTPQNRLAYVSARMPATYAAIQEVLKELIHEEPCESLLDVGSGSGTGCFAVCDILSKMKSVTAMELNKDMMNLAKKLAEGHPILGNAQWINADMSSENIEFPKSDMVLLSYSINEIPEIKREKLLEKLWNATNKYLIFVEPGTMESFQLIHKIREYFISKGREVLSPCPHKGPCPAFATNDLCHFSARVQRTSFHRYLKDGERGFEDEKFSYLILTKLNKKNFAPRVVRRPQLRPGMISFKLCTESGFQEKIFTKKNKEEYKLMKEKGLGDKI